MSNCLCLISACTRQDIHVLVLAARTSLVLTYHSSQSRSGQSRTGPKVPQGVWGEILSLAPTPAPSRAPEMHIFIPSYVPGVAEPQTSAPWVTTRLGSEGKTSDRDMV